MLVEILHGDSDLLISMVEQRGFPLHPALYDSMKPQSATKEIPHRDDKIADFVSANKTFAEFPSGRAGSGRQLLARLQSQRIYNALQF